MLTLNKLDHVRVHPPLARTRGWHGVAAASPSPAPPPPLALPQPACHGPRAPALRSPRPRRLLDGGGNTPAVLFGPVSRRRRRRPPHGGEHRALSGRVGVGTPRRTARAAPLRLWVPPRPGPGAPLRRASLPPACSSSLACSPAHPLAGSQAASTTSVKRPQVKGGWVSRLFFPYFWLSVRLIIFLHWLSRWHWPHIIVWGFFCLFSNTTYISTSDS